MALPNPWTTINIGDPIVYNDNLTDLRANADFLDSSAACVANNITVNGSNFSSDDSNKDNTVNPTAYISNDNPRYGTNLATNQYNQDVGYDIGEDATYYPGLNSGQYTSRNPGNNVGVNSTNYLSNFSYNYTTNWSSKQ